MHVIVVLLKVIPLLTMPAAGQRTASTDAPITHIGLVAPNIIGVTFRCGRAVYGKQIPYVREAGDHVDSSKDRWVSRNGKHLGSLVGADGKLLYTPDSVEGEPFAPDWDRAGSYTISVGKAVPAAPVDVYRKSKASDLARTGPWEFKAPSEDVIYLKLATPVRPGDRVEIRCTGDRPWTRAFTCDPLRIRSEAVHCSQIGFRPDDPGKLAFLSCWLGDGGGLTYDPLPAYSVVEDKTGRTVLVGHVRLGKPFSAKDEDAYRKNHNGTDVYEIDLSALSTPGRYRIVVDGIGCSYPVVIAPDVWRKAFITSARGFYHQRSGIALGPPYTTFRRPRCFHPDDGVKVYHSDTGLMDTGNGLAQEGSNFGNLVKGATDQIVPNAWGGYMDAGDWDRRIQHLDVSRLLLELNEEFPAVFSKVGLNIPESGSGLPDVISEALFNLDCYRRMQTPDGGIRGGIESEEHPRHGEGSWQESLRVYAYAPCVWSSYIYAGVAARASLALEKLRPALARQYRESAVRAMRWAEAELPKRAGKNNPHAVKDARNLAAAELYRLTGDREWHELFLATTALNKPDAVVYVYQDHEQSDAAWVYVRTRRPDVNKELQGYCRAALLKQADERVQQGKRTAFHWTSDPWRPFLWGIMSAPDGVALARGHYLSGDQKYLQSLVQACLPGAGASPSNICYTTGVGYRWPEHPLHIDSRISNQPPPPGLTVGGPRDMMMDKNGWEHGFLRPVTYPPPDQWPNAEAYFDVFWYPSMCEFTVQSPMAQNAYVWGYLAARK